MGMRCFCAQAQKQVDKCEIYLAISSFVLYFLTFISVGNAKCVEYMISWGADVDVIDLKGQTPLYVAVKNKHLPVIQVSKR